MSARQSISDSVRQFFSGTVIVADLVGALLALCIIVGVWLWLFISALNQTTER